MPILHFVYLFQLLEYQISLSIIDYSRFYFGQVEEEISDTDVHFVMWLVKPDQCGYLSILI